MRAGPKVFRVGKADLIHRFDPIRPGAQITMSARFLFPKGSPRNSVILMDLECASCGVPTNPGIRLYLRNGRIRVDRSKIGVKEPFDPNVDHQILPDVWHHIQWKVRLGEGENGESEIHLDGEAVSQAKGSTMLTKKVARALAKIDVLEQVDRFQVGLTANSNRSTAEVFVDDVSFCHTTRPPNRTRPPPERY